MGKRVHLNLDAVVVNPDAKVEIYSTTLGELEASEDKAVVQLARVYLEGHGHHVFDVSVFEGRIQLSADFNTWAAGFNSKLNFVMALGCAFEVA